MLLQQVGSDYNCLLSKIIIWKSGMTWLNFPFLIMGETFTITQYKTVFIDLWHMTCSKTILTLYNTFLGVLVKNMIFSSFISCDKALRILQMFLPGDRKCFCNKCALISYQNYSLPYCLSYWKKLYSSVIACVYYFWH